MNGDLGLKTSKVNSRYHEDSFALSRSSFHEHHPSFAPDLLHHVNSLDQQLFSSEELSLQRSLVLLLITIIRRGLDFVLVLSHQKPSGEGL